MISFKLSQPFPPGGSRRNTTVVRITASQRSSSPRWQSFLSKKWCNHSFQRRDGGIWATCYRSQYVSDRVGTGTSGPWPLPTASSRGALLIFLWWSKSAVDEKNKDQVYVKHLLSVLYNLATTLWNWYYYSHFTREETVAREDVSKRNIPKIIPLTILEHKQSKPTF